VFSYPVSLPPGVYSPPLFYLNVYHRPGPFPPMYPLLLPLDFLFPVYDPLSSSSLFLLLLHSLFSLRSPDRSSPFFPFPFFSFFPSFLSGGQFFFFFLFFLFFFFLRLLLLTFFFPFLATHEPPICPFGSFFFSLSLCSPF